MSNHSLADLSQYEVGRDRNIQIINDSLEINQVNKSILTIDIRLKKNVTIPKQSVETVKSKLFIDGPVQNFNMFIKEHKYLPITGVLRTRGFISPQQRNPLRVEIQNPYDYEIR